MQRFLSTPCQLIKLQHMKKSLFLHLFASAILLLFLDSCVKDNCKRIRTYTFYQPVYKTTEQVKAGIKSNAPREIQHPGKLFIRGNFIFLNEVDKGIHIINNQNPAAPQNIAFIDIPGCMDLAVKGDALYADLYTDLVTLDISNPMNVVVKKYVEGVFPYRIYSGNFYNDTSKIIVDWVRRDTTVTETCGGGFIGLFSSEFYMDSKAASPSSSGSPVGKGGSMARFAIVNNNMYTVSNNDLNVFNISSAFDPSYKTKVQISNQTVETIFPFENRLFIGSQSGMFIYNINNPEEPVLQGQFGHVMSCDPVIADDDYAYVTLRSGNWCAGVSNQLDVLKLNQLTNPELVKTYPFTNPHGLSKDGNLLFICDGTDGLKIYDASNVSDLKSIKNFAGIETYDVIAYNNIAIVVAKDGLYQYDYSNPHQIHLISKLTISRS